tara:strand:+ start:145 stop:855 length:711 start_codon:yes stop_codon:yes gene_type:complete
LKLIVDIGNSRTKLALFNKKDLIKHEITSEFSKNFLSNFCDNHLISSSIFSSVRKLNEADHRLISAYNGLLLDSKTPIPIQSNYKSSIGTDRLSAVVGANYLFPNKNIWVFDAGTCLTADYIDKKKTYHGGRITLGIEMRYKALNKHTSKLPNLELSEKSFFKGDTTENSIISGVQQGILAEVRTLISDFEKFNNDFIVLFTGGDSSFFEKELKNTIFADQFLVLKGLNEILDYNE